MKSTKESLLNRYIELARKLNKVPSVRETIKFLNVSNDYIRARFEKFSNLKEEAIKKNPSLEQMLMPAELNVTDIELYRLGLEGKKRKKKNNTTIQNVSTFDYIAQFSENVFKGKVTPNRKKKSNKEIKRAVHLVLSDLHFGADIKAEETGFTNYGKVEESRRFAEIIKQAIEYKSQYRDNTELHVNLLGDIIQHKLHDPQDAAPVSEQVCRAIHLLIQGFALLAESFPKVYIHCATGNHGRDLNRHKQRATSGKWDSIETIIYYAVKSALVKYNNLEFDIPKTPYVIYETLGHKIFSTHGDNVLNVGNPGNSLNIGRLESQLNRINASLKDTEEVKVAIVGHTHCASVSELSSGATVITNGCLVPTDQFAVSIGILENRASQTLFETVKDHPVGDVRFVRVGKKTDADKQLDSFIKPWEKF